ncbi:MAG: amino acid adenylation domain-containing protein, partial [Mucilaginibacter sp.]|uniref:non-ribosomal peptide synthetase n=1 Tax=Mucilaginibacter sp. TaxID=1882438 RepID=UPI0031AF76FC
EVSLLRDAEYEELVYGRNETGRAYDTGATLSRLFEEQAARTPDAVAVVYEGKRLSYRELNEKSNQLSRYIRAEYASRVGLEFSAGTLVGLYVDRGLELVIGILGVLKAGGAYVPLDIGSPQDRLDYYLEDTGVELLLTQRKLVEQGQVRLPEDKVVLIDQDAELYVTEQKSNPGSLSSPGDLAYVIYTSGTTGKPKGVMIEHHSVVNLLISLTEQYGITADDRFLLLSNYVFDAFVEQMGLALVSGGVLFIVSQHALTDSHNLENYIKDNGITHIHSTPSYLNTIDPHKLSSVKRVVFGGEYLSKATFDKYNLGGFTIINEYGPTETTITALFSFNTNHLNGPKINGTKAYILNQAMVPVPVGIIGELYLGGAGVARGYLNREELTAERFVQNPFATPEDKANGYTRLYKTGDMVRWLANGYIEYLGRNDDQVKIRGYRIELGEIENAILALKFIKQCCVLVKSTKTQTDNIKYLVAYYVPNQGELNHDQDAIAAALALSLPEYMIPAVFVPLEAIPLTTNGKVDRHRLPEPVLTAPNNEYVSPATPTEEMLAGIWQEVLGLKKIGITDNFFKIGGNSILAIQVSYRMSEALNAKVKVSDVFKYKSIAGILTMLQDKTDAYEDLVKAYSQHYDSVLPDLILIHPATAGSEVYQGMAEQLAGMYNCIGIDNYNLLNTNQIGNLNQLASHYLSSYEKGFSFKETIYLLGWSLGGQIALEMAAILEIRGYTHIKVILLDTYLSYFNDAGENDNYNKEDPDHLLHMLKENNYSDEHIANVIAAFQSDQQLASSPISCNLSHTQVTLFKATQKVMQSGESGNADLTLGALGYTEANNVDLAAENVEVIALDCNHLNILSTKNEVINSYLLSGKLNRRAALSTLQSIESDSLEIK